MSSRYAQKLIDEYAYKCGKEKRKNVSRFNLYILKEHMAAYNMWPRAICIHITHMCIFLQTDYDLPDLL